jgi:hypothetical protein
MEWKYDWGQRVRLEAKTARIKKKVELILERLGCQRVSEKTQQQQRRASDNQTPTKITRCDASTHGHVSIPRKPSKWLELFCVNRILRITELISFIGIIGVISVLRFIRTVSDIRAGLRESGRVLGSVLWSSGLWCKVACLRTIIQSKWLHWNPLNPATLA